MLASCAGCDLVNVNGQSLSISYRVITSQVCLCAQQVLALRDIFNI